LLLSRAKQHVALEAVTLGRRTRSMMDVVMDLKGPGVFMFDFVADRTQDASYRHRDYASYHSYASYSYLGRDNSYNYALTDAEGLEAYWAEQAAIWTDGARIDSADLNSDSDAEVTLARTRFPVSMERSTASWECP
jgi:hypothetical protein